MRGLNLTLQRGTITALVGRSGAGKTTVGSLISRFYEPSRGTISLAGRDVRSFTRGEWARAVALVSQEPVLFEGVGPARPLMPVCECVGEGEVGRDSGGVWEEERKGEDYPAAGSA